VNEHEKKGGGAGCTGSNDELAAAGSAADDSAVEDCLDTKSAADCVDPEDSLSTGDMARLSKTTLRTVRFYEQEGLIASQARDGGCHRKFSQAELKKLTIIADLREAGFSLHDIKTLIGLKNRCPTASTAACQMSDALNQRIAELKERIETLERVRSEFNSTLATLQRCAQCAEPDFPKRCAGCSVTNQPETSRATELLWKN
jgi:DNA-binding transcriptional MerR regulator